MPSFGTEHGFIHYEVFEATGRPPGEAPSLLLLHNFMSTGRSTWGPMLDSLSHEYRILLPDLPGHGRSVGHPDGFDHGIIAHQMAALVQVDGAAEIHLAGCSSGGMIAQLLVHNRLVDPASLTLVSTTYSNRRDVIGSAALVPGNFDASRAWLDATARLHEPYHDEKSYPSGYFRDVLLPGFRKLRLDATIDLPLDGLAGWTLPVCLIHGERDEFFGVDIAKDMAATLPDSALHVVPDQGHALIFRQPWKVLRLMLAFLSHQPVSQTQSAISPESDRRES